MSHRLPSPRFHIRIKQGLFIVKTVNVQEIDTSKFELEAEQMGRKEIQKSKWQKFAKQKCSEGREFHMNFLLFSLFYKLRHFSCKPDSKVLNYG
jgi:hypothetical protein